jgi:hypothetical protein
MNGKVVHTVEQYRAYYLRLIEACRQNLALYEQKLKMLDVFTADAKVSFSPNDKYTDWTLTPAVVDAVATMCETGTAHPDGVETLDVQKYLTGHGFKATDNFHVLLHVALKKLSDKNDGRLSVSADQRSIRRYKPGKLLGTRTGARKMLR